MAFAQEIPPNSFFLWVMRMVCEEQLSPSHPSSKGSSLRKLTHNEGQGPQDIQMERGGRAQGGVEGENHYPAWRVAKETPAACMCACVYVKERHQPCVCVCVCVCVSVCAHAPASS